MQITFVLGNGCNLSCTYCFERNRCGNENLNLDYAKTLIDDIYGTDSFCDIAEDECNILEFIGGEPFVYADTLMAIVDHFDSVINKRTGNKDYVIRIISNGVLLDTPKAKDFLDKYGKHTTLNCSIDGIKESHDKFRLDKNGNGSYDKAWNNFVSATADSKILKWTLTADTAKYYFDAMTFLFNQQDNFKFKVAQHFNNEDENLATYGYKDFSKCVCDLIEWYKNHDSDWIIKHPYIMDRCDFKPPFVDYYTKTSICAEHKICLDTDGFLVKCLCASKVSLNRPDSFVYGHIKDTQGNARIEMYKKAFRPTFVHKGIVGTDCFRCPIGNFCGSCFVSNYCHTGLTDDVLHYVCNCYAIKHLEHVFFNNFWIKTYLDNVPNAKTYMLSDNTMLVGNMFRKDVVLPKCWATEVVPESVYNEICDITEQLGGMATPLDTKFYSKEQVDLIGESLAKKSLSDNITIPKYKEIFQRGGC